MFIYIEFEGNYLRALIDTGSQINLIKRSIAEHIPRYIDYGIQIKGINGKSSTLGSVYINFWINDIYLSDILFHVIEDDSLGEYDCFLGSKFIVEKNCKIDCDNSTLSNDHFLTKLHFELINLNLDPILDSGNKIKSMVLSGLVQKIPVDYNDVLECDTGNSPSFSAIKNHEFSTDTNPLKIFRLDHLHPTLAYPLLDILQKYADVFEEINAHNLPNLTFDSLDVTTTKPIQTAIYRFPPAHNDLVLKEMENLLASNIISHSKSPYNSPVWIVPKKDGENGEKNYRVVIDYRKLNKVTIQDNYPLPNISDIIDQLGGAKFFSVMDLRQGFHQIALKPEDRYKTAFTVLGSHYHFNRMPFGLINSAPAFQRIMTFVLSGLIGKICFVYIDDIVVYGDTLDSHNRNLDVVLDRLSQNKLKVKVSKCHFLKQEINYLGYVISNEGVKMDKSKVNAIMSMQEPKNPKQLKSFLGMAGFYRRFIPNFGIIANPLHRLLRKDVQFEWDDDCQFAFKKLIEIISQDITLQYPDFTKTFYLTTDASNFGIGAVLSQENNGYDRPVAFISRSLNSAERNYSTTEKECLAIVWGVLEFRYYLTGRKFVIVSDHRPLVWLDSVADPGARLLRWRLKLNNYNYEIRYTPGKTNFVADELSRNGYSNYIENNPLFHERITTATSSAAVARGSLDQSNGNEDEDGDENETDEEPEDDVVQELIDFIPVEDREKITDESTIIELIKEQHSGPIGGHRGINATVKVIKLFFDIKGLREKVIKFIRSCDTCQRMKIDRQHRALPLALTATVPEPNYRIAFDIIGPFKYSDGRKLYGLTIQDEFTKFILFCGIKDCTAESVANALVENWILYYGIPKILVSDNGSNLCGEIMTSVANYFNIKRITTSIAHPQSNASVERAHARLAEFIRSTESEIECQTSWVSKLKLASFCYNTTVHSSTGFTPYYLMFGRQARPITAIGRPVELIPDSSLEKFNKNLRFIWKLAKENIDKKKIEAISKHEEKIKKRKIEEFSVGCKVLVDTEVFKGKINRTEPIWTGPFEVAEVSDFALGIKKRGGRISKVNKSRCKLYVKT